MVGSVSEQTWEIAAALARAGHTVHLFTRMAEGQRLHDHVFGVELHRCPSETTPIFVDEIKNLTESFLHYYREMVARSSAFDCILVHDWLALQAGLRIKQDEGVPLTVMFHSTEWGRSGVWPDNGEALKIAKIEEKGVREADLILAVSHLVRRELEQLFHPPEWKTRVLYHAINPSPYDQQPFNPGEVKRAMGIEPMTPTILFTGPLSFRRGPSLLLEALPTIRQKWPQLKALFLGEGKRRKHLEHEISRLGLGETAILLGRREGLERVRLLRSCDVVVIPAREDPFGKAVLEAWAASKPVVATKVGAIDELVWPETNAVLVSPEPEAIAKAVLDLFADFEKLRWLGRNGRVAVEQAFSREAVSERLLTLLREFCLAPRKNAELD